MNLFKHIPLIEISPGVKKSFDGVFEEMYIPLCHFSVSIVKDKSIAEDVVQSVFLKLWQERKKLRKLNNAKSYIYNCVRNASIDLLRKEKRISDVPIDVIQKENIESRIIEQEVRVELNKLLSLHLRLHPATTGIVKHSDLNQMKKTALFINTARAALVEEGALEAALTSGRPGRAALDVYPKEPIYDKNYPLLAIPNVLCSPHLGYVERESYELYYSIAFENCLNFIQGKPTGILALS